MTHTIYVDTREGKDMSLILGGLEYHTQKDKKYRIEAKQLPIGDIVCGDIVIERKDHRRGDFLNSMFDKNQHLETQMFNMLQYPHKFLIIVGDPYAFDRNTHKNCITGMIAKLNIDYSIRTHIVPTTDDYIYMAYRLIDRIVHPRELQPPTFHGDRRELTQKEVLINMVGQIKGIGQERATTIINDFEIECVADFSKLTWKTYYHLKAKGLASGVGEKIFALTQKNGN